MKQLSGQDAAFLYSDNTHSNSNVTLLHIYDQSTAPGGKLRFKSILSHIESRLHRSPMFRRKLQRVPLELDLPYWVEDENFDLEYHVRHLALPKPGDWRQFCIQVSRLHARPLDMNRPLWEVYVIEGLDSLLELPEGSFALVTKTHHAAIDIEHGSEITMLLHDTEPTPPDDTPMRPWFPQSPPRRSTMVWRGLKHTLTSPLRLAGPLVRGLAQLAPSGLDQVLGRNSGLARRPDRQPPATRFDSVVSPHRVFDTRRFGLADFKTIRLGVPGATVNDAVLAVCGGALRRYLDALDELPATSLTALAPISTRGAELPKARGKRPGSAPDADDDAPADLAWLQLRLGTDIADPMQRLAMVQAQTASSESVARAIGARELTDIARHAPAATLALTSKLLGHAALGVGRRAALANCTITNVPGPAVPLFLCGARMTYFSAILPITDGMGLAIAVTSYDGRIVISPTSCRELMPDPDAFAQCLRESFQESLAAAHRARRKATAAARAGSVQAPGPTGAPVLKPGPTSASARRPRSAAGTASLKTPAA